MARDYSKSSDKFSPENDIAVSARVTATDASAAKDELLEFSDLNSISAFQEKAQIVLPSQIVEEDLIPTPEMLLSDEHHEEAQVEEGPDVIPSSAAPQEMIYSDVNNEELLIEEGPGDIPLPQMLYSDENHEEFLIEAVQGGMLTPSIAQEMLYSDEHHEELLIEEVHGVIPTPAIAQEMLYSDENHEELFIEEGLGMLSPVVPQDMIYSDENHDELLIEEGPGMKLPAAALYSALQIEDIDISQDEAVVEQQAIAQYALHMEEIDTSNDEFTIEKPDAQESTASNVADFKSKYKDVMAKIATPIEVAENDVGPSFKI